MDKRRWTVLPTRFLWLFGRWCLVASAVLLQTAIAAENRCTEIAKLKLADAKVVAAQHHSAGRFTPSLLSCRSGRATNTFVRDSDRSLAT